MLGFSLCISHGGILTDRSLAVLRGKLQDSPSWRRGFLSPATEDVFFHSHRRRPTPKSTATARLPSAIHTSRLSEGQEGGHPVYRDRREDRDWLRGDSLMKCASAIGRPGKRGGGLSFIIQEKPGGESRIGPSGTCRQCPVSPRFTFHWWTLSTTQLWLPIISSYGLTFKMEHLC